MSRVVRQVAKAKDGPRTQMVASEIACLNGDVELFAAGTVEHVGATRCIDGAPGEGGAIVQAMELSIRDATNGKLHIRTIPLSRLNENEVREGVAVRMYVTKRGWSNHILTWHVLPNID